MVAPTPIRTAKAWVSSASAERTLIDASERRPTRTRCVWTAAAASTADSPTRSGPMASSVRNSSLWPPRTAASASALTRAMASRSRSGPPPTGKVQSIVAARSANASRNRAHSADSSTGEGSSSTPPPSVTSRMLPRLAKRVVSDMTCRSRNGSIGGFVTWLKFWRKNWLTRRGLSETTASGVSSPIEPTASFALSAIGARISSRSSSVCPAAT